MLDTFLRQFITVWLLYKLTRCLSLVCTVFSLSSKLTRWFMIFFWRCWDVSNFYACQNKNNFLKKTTKVLFQMLFVFLSKLSLSLKCWIKRKEYLEPWFRLGADLPGVLDGVTEGLCLACFSQWIGDDTWEVTESSGIFIVVALSGAFLCSLCSPSQACRQNAKPNYRDASNKQIWDENKAGAACILSLWISSFLTLH